MTEKSAPKENVDTLHEHEEQLRAESLTLIAKLANLTDHWKLVQEAMNVIYAFADDHVHGSDDELTMQFLGKLAHNMSDEARHFFRRRAAHDQDKKRQTERFSSISSMTKFGPAGKCRPTQAVLMPSRIHADSMSIKERLSSHERWLSRPLDTIRAVRSEHSCKALTL